jgi:hypothetical protein
MAKSKKTIPSGDTSLTNNELAFLMFNLKGKGEPNTSPDGTWRRGPVMFNHVTGIWRVVEDYWGDKVLLKRSSNPGKPECILRTNEGFDIPVLWVPHIGVFSKFVGDTVPINEAFHERNKFLFVSMARFIVREEIATTPIQTIIERAWIMDNAKRQIDHYLPDAWREYSATFQLRWDPFPGHYYNEMVEDVERRKEAYLDPTAVARRERAAARRTAMKALEL